MTKVRFTWDVLVTLQKTGGKDGDSRHSGVPIGRTIHGFLSHESLDPDSGLPAVGSRIEIPDAKFSSSDVLSVEPRAAEDSVFDIKTETGVYVMVVHRRKKLKSNL